MNSFLTAIAICFCAATFSVLAGCSSDTLEESTELWLEAEQALTSGDSQLAIEKLNGAIAAGAGEQAILKRARLYADQGKDDLAKTDCESVLAMNPKSQDAKWILSELTKATDRRFQGTSSTPPSHNK